MTLAVLLVLACAFIGGGTEAAEHVVTTPTGAAEWTVGAASAPITATVGDTIVFNYNAGHDVVKMADQAAFDACTTTGNAELANNTVGGGTAPTTNQYTYPVTSADATAGTIYFSCSYSPLGSYSHCPNQKLTVTVTTPATTAMATTAMATTMAPTMAPTTAPATTAMATTAMATTMAPTMAPTTTDPCAACTAAGLEAVCDPLGNRVLKSVRYNDACGTKTDSPCVDGQSSCSPACQTALNNWATTCGPTNCPVTIGPAGNAEINFTQSLPTITKDAQDGHCAMPAGYNTTAPVVYNPVRSGVQCSNDRYARCIADQSRVLCKPVDASWNNNWSPASHTAAPIRAALLFNTTAPNTCFGYESSVCVFNGSCPAACQDAIDAWYSDCTNCKGSGPGLRLFNQVCNQDVYTAFIRGIGCTVPANKGIATDAATTNYSTLCRPPAPAPTSTSGSGSGAGTASPSAAATAVVVLSASPLLFSVLRL